MECFRSVSRQHQADPTSSALLAVLVAARNGPLGQAKVFGEACPLGGPQPLIGPSRAKQGKSVAQRIVGRAAQRVVGEEVAETVDLQDPAADACPFGKRMADLHVAGAARRPPLLDHAPQFRPDLRGVARQVFELRVSDGDWRSTALPTSSRWIGRQRLSRSVDSEP